MRDYLRATCNTQWGLAILYETFGNPIDHQALCLKMASDLAPFVGDASELQSAIEQGTHLSEYAHFLLIRGNQEQNAAFNELCGLWSRAKAICPDGFGDSFEHYFGPKRKAIRDYANLFYLERQKGCTPDELTVKIAFSEIGQIIEGCIQPFAKHFLHLKRLASGATATISPSEVAKLSLGQAIAELGKVPTLSPLYSPLPWGLSLSQWRNIAQHCSYEYLSVGQIVSCEYGTPPKKKRIEIPYVHIHDLCKCINDTYCIHKTAESILSLGVPELTSSLVRRSHISPDTVVSCITEVLHANSLNVLSVDPGSSPWELLAIDPLNRGEGQIQEVLNRVAQFTSVLEECQILFVIKEKDTGRIHTGLMGKVQPEDLHGPGTAGAVPGQ